MGDQRDQRAAGRGQGLRRVGRVSPQRAVFRSSSARWIHYYIRKFVIFAQIFEGGKGPRASARFTARSHDCADFTVSFVREVKRAEALAPLIADGALGQTRSTCPEVLTGVNWR